MTAQVFTADVKDRGAFYNSEGYGNIKVDGTADTALAGVTTTDSVRTVLDILSANVGRNRVTTGSTTGLATSVLTSNAPSDIALSAATLTVGANGTTTPVTVGTLSSVSIDGSKTYSLVTGTGSTNNSVFNISGTTLRYVGGAATEGTLSIRVRVTDSVGQTYEEALTITVA